MMEKRKAIELLDKWYQKQKAEEFWGLGIISIAMLDFINMLYDGGLEIADRKIHKEEK